MKRLSILSVIVVLGGTLAAQSQGPSPAPTPQPEIDVDPSSREFAIFVDTLQEVQRMQKQLYERIGTEVSESALGEDRFNEIHQVMRSGDATATEQVPEQDKRAYESLMSRIRELQSQSQSVMVEVVEESDMTVEGFNNYILAVRTDPELQEAVQERLQ